ncbi:hypothetical protein Tco_1069771 [Tanacetum coccineum]|uniref:Reverse transcriptase domain-containing protein n=1 Tax=Tanacetum coccineum TaxID=301880 RepID=A0ABQ5HKM7_9ASTR
MMDIYDDRFKDVCELESNDSSSPTSSIVEEFDSFVGEIIKQKEEVKKISDLVARRRACLENFRIIHQGRVIHSPQIASVCAISHIFPNNNLEDSFKMGDEDLNFIPNKELDKEDLIPIPRESKIGKECGDTPIISYDNFESVKRIDLIDATCAEYAPKVLDFTESGDSTSIISDPPSFTPFEGSEMILEEEIEEFLKHDESLNMDLNDEFNDEEGDITYLEKLLEVLNDDPFSPLTPLEFKKEVKNVESVKTSIEEPPELELKELPSHLEYAFLEKDNKLPVIISKDLKDDEKVKLIEVLKAHKSALAWKISDIKGIDPKFCTHKILMEDDYKPVTMVQMQRMWSTLKYMRLLRKRSSSFLMPA